MPPMICHLARNWAKGLSAHISRAYLIQRLNAGDADILIATIKDFNDYFSGIEFEFTRGDVMNFDDMDHYFAL